MTLNTQSTTRGHIGAILSNDTCKKKKDQTQKGCLLSYTYTYSYRLIVIREFCIHDIHPLPLVLVFILKFCLLSDTQMIWKMAVITDII